MKKTQILSVAIIVISLTAAINLYITQSDNTTTLSLLATNMQALSNDEGPTIIELRNQKDNPGSCSTQKTVTVKVDLGNGQFKTEIQVITVTGLENPCKDEKDETCSAFACFSESYKDGVSFQGTSF